MELTKKVDLPSRICGLSPTKKLILKLVYVSKVDNINIIIKRLVISRQATWEHIHELENDGWLVLHKMGKFIEIKPKFGLSELSTLLVMCEDYFQKVPFNRHKVIMKLPIIYRPPTLERILQDNGFEKKDMNHWYFLIRNIEGINIRINTRAVMLYFPKGFDQRYMTLAEHNRKGIYVEKAVSVRDYLMSLVKGFALESTQFVHQHTAVELHPLAQFANGIEKAAGKKQHYNDGIVGLDRSENKPSYDIETSYSAMLRRELKGLSDIWRAGSTTADYIFGLQREIEQIKSTISGAGWKVDNGSSFLTDSDSHV